MGNKIIRKYSIFQKKSHTHMTLMAICNGKSSVTVSNFHIIIICKIICHSLDNEKFNGPINSGIDVSCLDIAVYCRPNGCWLKKFNTKCEVQWVNVIISLYLINGRLIRRVNENWSLIVNVRHANDNWNVATPTWHWLDWTRNLEREKFSVNC